MIHEFECSTIEAPREGRLHGRETIRRLTEQFEKELLADRECGRNSYTITQLRQKAYERALALVSEKVAEYDLTGFK